MKTILLLMCSLFLISQVSFGKEIHTNASAGKKDIKLERTAFKDSTVTKKTLIESHRIWLNLTNAGGAFKQLLVAYITGATNGFDRMYDGISTDSNPYIDFYSIDGGRNLTIQGRGLPFLTTDEVPLGYKTNIVGTFNITIDEVDGLFVNQDIFLKDLVTGVTHNLKNGTYSFTTLAGRFNDRFVLLYVNTAPVTPVVVVEPIVSVPEVPAPTVTEPTVTVPVVPEPVVTVPEVPAPIVTEPIVTVPEVPAPIVTEPIVIVPVVPAPIVTEPVVILSEVPVSIAANSVRNHNGKGNSVIVSVNDNQITINSVEGDINEVYVFSMGQKQLFGRRNINTNEYVIADLGVAKQVLIIKTQLKNGKWISSKIIL
jgi:hypothetical protein